jgi:hypothetical protein
VTFEVWCNAQGLTVHLCGPYHVMTWLRQIAPRGAGYCWAELQKVSEAFGGVGLSDPTLSPLVIGEFDKISPIEPPHGWKGAEIEAWKRIPHDIKKITVHRRAQDMKAVRACQNVEAAYKRGELGKDIVNART